MTPDTIGTLDKTGEPGGPQSGTGKAVQRLSPAGHLASTQLRVAHRVPRPVRQAVFDLTNGPSTTTAGLRRSTKRAKHEL